MIVHMSVVLLVSGVLGALGAHLDVDSEAPPDASPPDIFTYHLAPRITASDTWNNVDYFDTFDQIPEERYKRAGNSPMLSIVAPMDVLRQRLMLEMARNKMLESQKQLLENRKMMKNIGKRGFLRQPYTRF